MFPFIKKSRRKGKSAALRIISDVYYTCVYAWVSIIEDGKKS